MWICRDGGFSKFKIQGTQRHPRDILQIDDRWVSSVLFSLSVIELPLWFVGEMPSARFSVYDSSPFAMEKWPRYRGTGKAIAISCAAKENTNTSEVTEITDHVEKCLSKISQNQSSRQQCSQMSSCASAWNLVSQLGDSKQFSDWALKRGFSFSLLTSLY